MPALAPIIQEYIETAVAEMCPHSLLELSPAPSIGTDHSCVTLHRRHTFTDSFELADIIGIAPVDLAVVIDAPAYLDKTNVERLLAYLRNTGVRSILAVQDTHTESAGERWRIGDFLALGFRRAEGARTLSSTHQIYRYDIRDYKLTPDWLNSNHWANPEQWDKKRW